MDKLGVCLRIPNVWPQLEEEYKDLENRIIRLKLIRRNTFITWLYSLPQSVSICVLIDGETEGGYGSDTAAWLAELQDPRIKWIVVINEGDTFSDITPKYAADCFLRVREILLALQSPIIPVPCSVVSQNWIEFLEAMLTRLREYGVIPKYIALHPYTQYGQKLVDIIKQASRIALGAKVICDEYGFTLEQMGDNFDNEVDKLHDLVQTIEELEFLCWFGYTDDIRSPGEGRFGLMTGDHIKRNAYFNWARKLKESEKKMSYESDHQVIRAIARYYGVPEIAALAMCDVESAFNDSAVGDGGHSVGWYQLHDQGMGYGLGDLRYIGPINAAIALRHLRDTSSDGSWGEWCARSQRPFDPIAYAREVDNRVANADRLYPSNDTGNVGTNLDQWINAVAYLGDNLSDITAAVDNLLKKETVTLSEAETMSENLNHVASELRRVREEMVGPRPDA